MNYKEQLSNMLKKVDIMARLRVSQARDWDSPWFEGVYYGNHILDSRGIISLDTVA